MAPTEAGSDVGPCTYELSCRDDAPYVCNDPGSSVWCQFVVWRLSLSGKSGST